MYPELFRASPGAQLQEITVNPFFIQLGQNTITIPDQIEKIVWAPGEAGNSSG